MISNLGWTRKLTTLGLVVAGSVALANTAPTAPTAATPATGTTTAAVPAPAPTGGSVVGMVDLRPSYLPGNGTFYSENAIEGGYKFNSTLAVSYVQFFNTNIFDSKSAETSGVNLTFPGGFVRTRINGLYTNGDFKVGGQNRIYLPLTVAERDRGKLFTMRQYINMTQKVNDTLTVTFTVLPIFHAYSRQGVGTSANPGFENRFYLTPDIKISDKLSFAMPVMFHQTKFRTYAGAANSGAWNYFLWVYPELTYSLDDNMSVGVAYYSDNLIKADLSGGNLSDGLRNGVAQVAFTMTL